MKRPVLISLISIGASMLIVSFFQIDSTLKAVFGLAGTLLIFAPLYLLYRYHQIEDDAIRDYSHDISPDHLRKESNNIFSIRYGAKRERFEQALREKYRQGTSFVDRYGNTHCVIDTDFGYPPPTDSGFISQMLARTHTVMTIHTDGGSTVISKAKATVQNNTTYENCGNTVIGSVNNGSAVVSTRFSITNADSQAIQKVLEYLKEEKSFDPEKTAYAIKTLESLQSGNRLSETEKTSTVDFLKSIASSIAGTTVFEAVKTIIGIIAMAP